MRTTRQQLREIISDLENDKKEELISVIYDIMMDNRTGDQDEDFAAAKDELAADGMATDADLDKIQLDDILQMRGPLTMEKKMIKITKRQLKRIIKEEKARLLKESQDVHRFEEIMQEMYELNEEALRIVDESGTASRERAYRYWYAHIQGAIGQDSDFLGGSMISMSDTLEELNSPDEEQMAEEGYKDGASGKEPVYPDNEVYMINYEDGYEDSIPD